MLKSFLRFLGIVKDKRRRDESDPIYGYPKRSIDDWLSHNPVLKKEYEAKLRIRSSRSRT
jgi:hypothetical protein